MFSTSLSSFGDHRYFSFESIKLAKSHCTHQEYFNWPGHLLSFIALDSGIADIKAATIRALSFVQDFGSWIIEKG